MAQSKKVFLDANVLIGAGKPPGGLEIERMGDLVKAGLVSVLTTDLTVTEVAKKHTLNDLEVIGEIGRPHFRQLVQVAVGVELPAIKKSELKEKLLKSYLASTAKMLDALKAKTVTIDEVKPSVVFDDYAKGEGFFTGEGKKDQFPDAFAFECLKSEASADTPVIIVSNDGDFEAPSKGQAHISVVKSLPDLFAALGLKVEAPEIEAFLEANLEALCENVDKELGNWGLQGDVEDSEIDTMEVVEVEVLDYIAFKQLKDGDPILVIGEIKAVVNVSYSHPNWDEAMWDSEDKVLIPFEDVSGDTQVELIIGVSMLIGVDDEDEPFEIENLQFRNHDFMYITLSNHDYDY